MVNTVSTYRRGEYFRKEIMAVAGGDKEAGVGYREHANGGTDARVELTGGGTKALPDASEAAKTVSTVGTGRVAVYDFNKPARECNVLWGQWGAKGCSK
jgi:hypothetical protein